MKGVCQHHAWAGLVLPAPETKVLQQNSQSNCLWQQSSPSSHRFTTEGGDKTPSSDKMIVLRAVCGVLIHAFSQDLQCTMKDVPNWFDKTLGVCNIPAPNDFILLCQTEHNTPTKQQFGWQNFFQTPKILDVVIEVLQHTLSEHIVVLLAFYSVFVWRSFVIASSLRREVLCHIANVGCMLALSCLT